MSLPDLRQPVEDPPHSLQLPDPLTRSLRIRFPLPKVFRLIPHDLVEELTLLIKIIVGLNQASCLLIRACSLLRRELNEGCPGRCRYRDLRHRAALLDNGQTCPRLTIDGTRLIEYLVVCQFELIEDGSDRAPGVAVEEKSLFTFTNIERRLLVVVSRTLNLVSAA